MEKEKLFRIIYWVLFACAVGSLWISLRTQLYQLEYSIIAVAFWGAAYLFNKKVMPKNE